MMASLPSQQINRRYRILETLGIGSGGTVYRAFDRLTGKQVALKQVGLPPETLTLTATQTLSDPRIGLANEFRVLASLRHPNIISVIDYGFDDYLRPYLTMELVEPARDLRKVVSEMDFRGKVLLLMDILRGLTYLHRHRIVHSDMKPDNIVVDGEGHAKILDFGLAMEHSIFNTMRGTLAYMAPEVMRGDSISAATDLYSVGIMAYEFFCYRRPFMSRDFGRFVTDTLQTAPNMTRLRKRGVPEALIGVIAGLLAKSPTERFSDAQIVMERIAEAANVPLPPEDDLLRESFLQSAPLVGRHEEMTLLEQSLHEAVSGTGSAWLISGEMGVGKTRLVEEFRAYALVNGAFVLKSAATESDESSSAMWQEILLMLMTLIEIQDQEASRLKGLLPALDRLLERNTPEPMDSQSTIALLMTLARIFQRQKRPTVLILEDIHWAKDSLHFLNMLYRVVRYLPVVIVGTCRTEDDPFFYGRLPTMQQMALPRLTHEEITALSGAMLGTEGSNPRFLHMLEQATEGNTSFIIDVIRTLASNYNSLSNVTDITIPDVLISRSMIEVAHRRLRHVPQEYQPMLRVATVLRRTLDLDLLHVMDDSTDILEWVQACVNAAILELHNGQWRFTHDKLRHTILAQLAPEEQSRLHTLAALAIETLYPDNPTYYEDLYHHWRETGDLVKQAYYRGKLG